VKHRRHHRVFIGGLAYAAPYYVYANYDSCYWLKRRALYTGSGYWWSRYYECLEDHGY
jgi:hypothetical protein